MASRSGLCPVALMDGSPCPGLRVKPWISKDYDVVVSCISLLVGGILIFQVRCLPGALCWEERVAVTYTFGHALPTC